MTAQQLRDAWNVAEVVIEEIVAAAESMTGKTDAEKEAWVKDEAHKAVEALLDHQGVLTGTTSALAKKGIELVLDLIIDRVWTAYTAKHAPPAVVPAAA